jgi:hypothetical protein
MNLGIMEVNLSALDVHLFCQEIVNSLTMLFIDIEILFFFVLMICCFPCTLHIEDKICDTHTD